MQNLDMIMRLLKRMTPGMDVKAIADEIRERIVEELDYELEAQNQRSLARIFAGHPFIVVPDVVSVALARAGARQRVRRGRRLRGAQGPLRRPSATASGRSSSASSSAASTATASSPATPIPGNFLLLADGRVAFLDFGLFKRMERRAGGARARLPAGGRRGRRGDAARLLAESGFLPEPERVDPDHLLAFIKDAIWWYTTADEAVQLTPGDRHAR